MALGYRKFDKETRRNFRRRVRSATFGRERMAQREYVHVQKHLARKARRNWEKRETLHLINEALS